MIGPWCGLAAVSLQYLAYKISPGMQVHGIREAIAAGRVAGLAFGLVPGSGGLGAIMSEIQRVGIVGCGIMGSGIAEVCARSGLDVLVVVPSEASAVAGRRRMVRSLGHALSKGRVTEQARDAALGRIAFTCDLADFEDRQLVVETVPEHEATKLGVFASLAKVVRDPAAILATNTSSLSVIRLAQATGRADHVIGMHFFNPAPAMPLVEIVSSLLTADQTRDAAGSFATGVLGKEVIQSPDRAGFVVNALLVPYLLAAIRMAESGRASAEVIDTGMTLGCSHPMGPLRLTDLIGLDTIASIAASLYEESKDPCLSPPPLLLRMVEAGMLGKKTGTGFHHYS
jgi:3-hydroxybutyryl-CoA dehydrogenase